MRKTKRSKKFLNKRGNNGAVIWHVTRREFKERKWSKKKNKEVGKKVPARVVSSELKIVGTDPWEAGICIHGSYSEAEKLSKSLLEYTKELKSAEKWRKAKRGVGA